MTSLTRCAGGNSHRQNPRADPDQPGRTLTVRHVSVGRKRSVLPGQLAPGDPGSGLSRSGQLGFSGCGSRARMDMRARLARGTWLSGKPSEHGLRISNYRFELGGAMGIRTPDLLHAMQVRQPACQERYRPLPADLVHRRARESLPVAGRWLSTWLSAAP
jgi:hypothetical protein